jgi:dCMP deaminase
MTQLASTWDVRYLRLAREVASWSKDPKRHVGCVLVNYDKRIVSTGCNGLPTRMDYDEVRLKYLLSREQVKQLTLHAEVNALIDATRAFSTCYVWPTMPCVNCAIQLAQAGCVKFVSTAPASEEWEPHLVQLLVMKYSIQQAFISTEQLNDQLS